MGALARLLAHRLTRDLPLDDPRTTLARRRVLHEKVLLRGVYEDWYRALAAALPPFEGRVLELGAGAGFLDEHLPDLVRSEVFWLPGIDVVLDGLALPFGDGALRAIAMTNVLHHLPSVDRFFTDAARCVRPGGTVAMIEPWSTPWSRLVYRRLHHEPFDPDAVAWQAAGDGPLSRANGALPWILFVRDRERFAKRHPEWLLRRIEPMMPLRYLIAGGVSLRNLVPGLTAPLWRGIEALLAPWRRHLAMFALVVLERAAGEPARPLP